MVIFWSLVFSCAASISNKSAERRNNKRKIVNQQLGKKYKKERKVITQKSFRQVARCSLN